VSISFILSLQPIRSSSAIATSTLVIQRDSYYPTKFIQLIFIQRTQISAFEIFYSISATSQ